MTGGCRFYMNILERSITFKIKEERGQLNASGEQRDIIRRAQSGKGKTAGWLTF